MAVPFVRNPTWADGSGGGTSIDAADLNNIEAGIFDISYAPAVRVFHNASQSITDSTFTALAFNSERFDQKGNAADTMHDTVTNNSRLTCRYAGVYEIAGCIEWASGATGYRFLAIRLNGSTYIARKHVATISGVTLSMELAAPPYLLAVNDYVELVVLHTQGAALNVNSAGNYSPEFGMTRVA